MDRGLEIVTFPKNIQIAKKHMKRYSISQIIRGMQIKTRISCHFTLVRIAIVKEIRTRFGENAEKRKPLYIVGR